MPLGSGFNQLHNLSELLFTKGKVPCAMIPENMFQNIENSSLKYLDMSGVEFTRVKGAWNLPHLETLKLNDNQFLMHDAPDIFREQGLSKMLNLKHLYLQNVTLGDKQFNEIVYNGGMNLKTLKIDRNVITLIYVVIHWKMPKLETFSITENQLLSTAYLLADIMTLKHLKYANLSRQNNIFSSSNQRHRRYSFTWKDKTELCFANPDRACSFGVPENLTLLDLSSSTFKLPTIPELILMNNNTLHFVDLSSNAIQKLPRPFYCAHNIKPAIKSLDLSNNKIECITSSFFTHCDWSSLNILKLNQNQLKQRVLGDCGGKGIEPLSFIKPLLNLTKLVLSGNELNWEMNPKTFENQTNLEELLLSNTRMQTFTSEIGHMTKLRYLDLSSNNIKCLSENTTMALKNLKSKSIGILQVNLENNPLQCSCECYSFLKWYKYTDIEFTGKNNLYCMSGKNIFKLSNISKVLMILDAACFPRTWLNVMIGIEVTTCIIITIFSIYERYKYRIYFFYLRCRVLLLSKIVAEDVKQFHAFISYASPDRQWVKKKLIKNLEKTRKLKLLVASRDFEPGKLITVNIHSAITTSSKTVFVISKSFLKSCWCLEEFSMALTVSKEHSYMNLLS